MEGIMEASAQEKLMKNLSRTAVLAVLFAASASMAQAGDLKLTIANGRVTLVAQDVPVRQILAEWARVGHTTIVNGDKVVGPSLTLQLVNQPEREALEILLKSAAGYVAAQRQVVMAEASVFDRIMILPTSRAPAYSGSPAPPPLPQFNRMAQPAPDEDDQPVEPVPMPAPLGPPGTAYPGQFAPGQQPGQPPPPQTAPRPGVLPAPPQQSPMNPYGTPMAPGQPLSAPGVRPPGGPGGPG